MDKKPQLVLVVSLLVPGALAAQGFGPASIVPPSVPPAIGRPVPQAALEDEGPAAALRFERESRGAAVNPHARQQYYSGHAHRMRYPEASPVAIRGLKNIVAMGPDLSTIEEIEADFRKNRSPEQVGILIFLKTEYCHQNDYRGCAVATAALEKRATPLLRRFRVYGAWIEALSSDNQLAGYGVWLKEVQRYYKFDQGPGANLFAVIPGGARHRSDAGKLGLYLSEFEANQGAAPKLESWLAQILSEIK